MVATAPLGFWPPDPPAVDQIVTEDDAPVDNFPSEKQQRLLVETLYASWEGPPVEQEGSSRDEGQRPRTFLAASNVGLFPTPKSDPLVPDVLVSLDVALHPDIWAKEHRSYFFWEIGKAPDVVIEIVSNREGGELDRKRRGYAKMGVPYYVVYDPARQLGVSPLYVWELRGHVYVPVEPWFEMLGLGLVEWPGQYEDMSAVWLRWRRRDGSLVPTGAERAETEKRRAETEKRRAETEKQRADRMAEKLRALGLDPDSL